MAFLPMTKSGGGNTKIVLAYSNYSKNNSTLSMAIEEGCWYQINASMRYSEDSYGSRQSCLILSPEKVLTLLFGSNASSGGASWSYVYVSGNTLYMKGTSSSRYTDFIVTKITIE